MPRKRRGKQISSETLHGSPDIVRAILAGVVLTGAIAVSPALAVWTEPNTSSPDGTAGVPVMGTGDVTKSGSLEFSAGAVANGPNAGAGGVATGIRGIGSFNSFGTVSPGVYGRGNTTAVNLGAVPNPLQVGVYGMAGADNPGSTGVYGNDNGLSNAWAGYFLGGITGFEGALSVSGPNSGVVAPYGAVITNSFTASPVGLSVTSSTNGKAALLGTIQTFPASALTFPADGYGVRGSIASNLPACVAANCSGLLGASTDTYTLRVGKWGGYFVGNVYATERVFVNAQAASPSLSLTDPVTYRPPAFAGLPSGTLLGARVVTGGAVDATGGVTSDGANLLVTDYGGSDSVIARVNPGTLSTDSASDQRDLSPSASAEVTYDGKNYWIRDGNTLRKVDGASLTEVAQWALPGNADGARPKYDRGSVWIGTRKNPLGIDTLDVIRVNASGSLTEDVTSTETCFTPRQVEAISPFSFTSAAFIYFPVVSGACVPSTLTSLDIYSPTAGNIGRIDYGNNGTAVGIVYDGANLWISTQNNWYPAGDARNGDVRVLQVLPYDPNTVFRNLDLPGTVGYTAGPIAFDGRYVWVPASTFGTNGFGSDGKLFRVTVADGTVTEISRASGPVGASPIDDLYFDGSAIWLYGYNSSAVPRINYYLEKRLR